MELVKGPCRCEMAMLLQNAHALSHIDTPATRVYSADMFIICNRLTVAVMNGCHAYVLRTWHGLESVRQGFMVIDKFLARTVKPTLGFKHAHYLLQID